VAFLAAPSPSVWLVFIFHLHLAVPCPVCRCSWWLSTFPLYIAQPHTSISSRPLSTKGCWECYCVVFS